MSKYPERPTALHKAVAWVGTTRQSGVREVKATLAPLVTICKECTVTRKTKFIYQ